MAGLKEFRVYTVDLASGEERMIDASGDYIAVLDATGTFKIGVENNAMTDFFAGLKVNLTGGDNFSKLRVRDTSGAPNTVVVVVGYGDFQDARLVVAGGLSVTATIVKSTAFASIPDVSLASASVTVVRAASATRRELVISNLAANVSTIRVGDAAAAAGEGAELAPGQSLVLTTGGAVYAYNPGAVQLVGVVETND